MADAAAPRALTDRLIQALNPRVDPRFAPPPVEVAPGLWSLERRSVLLGGLSLVTRSKLIRLPSGGLLVVAPPPTSPGGVEALDALGPVEEILAPNSFHHLNARDFMERHPRALLRLAPGLPERVSGLPSGQVLTPALPATWAGALEHAILGPVRGISEVVLFHRASATLIVTDLASNVANLESPLQRLLWMLIGVPAKFGPSRTVRTLLLHDRSIAAPFLARVLEWPFQRVLMSHGQMLDRDARQAFREAFSAYH